MKRKYVKPEIKSERLEATSLAGTCACSGDDVGSFIIDAVNNWLSGG